MAAFNILILAAGEGKRMGRAKQLIPFQGKTFIEHTMNKALQLGAEKVYIVLGAHLENLKPLVSTYVVEKVENPNWSEGMGHSLATGVQHILSKGKSDHGLLIMLIDQPLIMSDPTYLPQLVSIWREYPDKIVATRYGNHYGVPCLFPAKMVPHLLDCKGDRGAGPLLNSGEIEVMGIKAGKLVVDVDTESDFLGL